MDGSKGRESVRQCQRCGRGFSGVSHNGRERRFCSKECAWSAQVKRPFATCRQCGREYLTSRNSKGMFCSKECQWDSMRVSHESERGYAEAVRWMESLSRRMAREERTLIAIGCEQCGRTFLTTRRGARFCSGRCRRRSHDRGRDTRVYKNGEPDLSITLERLFIRDGGRCRSCGVPMTLKGDSNGEGYPSIDHIIPLAKGGLHRWDNVQLMCRGCNSRKRDSLAGAHFAEAAAWFRGRPASEDGQPPRTASLRGEPKPFIYPHPDAWRAVGVLSRRGQVAPRPKNRNFP